MRKGFVSDRQQAEPPRVDAGARVEQRRPAQGTVAAAVEPVLSSVFVSGLPVQFVFWDGSTLGPEDSPGRVILHTPRAARRLLWSPLDVGWARAYAAGEVDLEGDIFELADGVRKSVPRDASLTLRGAAAGVMAASRLGVLGPPLPPPPEEVRFPSRLRRALSDAEAISHHYDVGNEFYRLVIGPSLTYSCAYFADARMSLEEAQAAKHELICRKLGLPERPGARLLDVGCGWGSMAIHAASRHEARVVGVTISREQAGLAAERVKEEGLDDRVEIRLQNYRDLAGEQFDAISSIGMFEHVSAEALAGYFETMAKLLTPRGRMLNHAISSRGRARFSPDSFIGRYVFPNGELADVAEVVEGMQQAGFEVRDVESLREHYERTLRYWVANLEQNWDAAVELAGEGRARIWRLYMAGSATGFRAGRMGLHQVLGVIPEPDGSSGMPPTRTSWSRPI